MTDAPELKGCPFCGNAAVIEHGSDHHGSWFSLGCSRHWGAVGLDNACLGGRLFYTDTERDERDAIAAWNTRANLIPEMLAAERAAGRREGLEAAAQSVCNSVGEFTHPATHYTFGRLAAAIRALIGEAKP